MKSSGPVTFAIATFDVTRQHGDADQAVAVDHDALRVLVEARDTAVRHARCRIGRHRVEDGDARLAHRPRRRRSAPRRSRRIRRSARPRSATRRASACPRTARADRAIRPDREWRSSASPPREGPHRSHRRRRRRAARLSICVRPKNSLTVPRAATSSPTATAGVAAVNTKRPSDVAGSASAAASGACRKKPFDLMPVTMPVVMTSCPANGDTKPLPWMSWIAAGTGMQLRGGDRGVARHRVADREVDVVVVGVETAAALANRRGDVARRCDRSGPLEAARGAVADEIRGAGRRAGAGDRHGRHLQRNLAGAGGHGNRAGRVRRRQRRRSRRSRAPLNEVVAAGRECCPRAASPATFLSRPPTCTAPTTRRGSRSLCRD